MDIAACLALLWGVFMLPAPAFAQEGQAAPDADIRSETGIDAGSDTGADGANDADGADGEEGPILRLHPYAQARLAEIDRAMPRAVAAYREALAADPGSVDVARRGYRQAVLAGDRPLALAAARLLDAAEQLSRDGSVLLLADALDRRQWNEAAARIDRLETEGNLAFLAPFMRGWLSLAQKRYSPPEPVPDDASAAFGNRYRAEQLLLLALARGDRNGLDQAYADAADGIEDMGAEEQAMIAARLVKLGRRDLAERLLAEGEATWAGPDAAAALKRVGKLYRKRAFTPQYALGVLLTRLVDDLRGQGEGIATLSIARMAGFADPQSDDVRVTVARAALMADYPQIAEAEAAKVAPSSPAWFDAEAMRLRALVAQDREAEAVARAQQLVAQNEGNARGWRLLGDLMAQRDDFAGAAQAYGRARDALGGREDASLLLQLGGALEQAGQWAEARPLLERVVELAPDSAVALNHLGYALADRGEDLPRAIELLEKANRIRPREPAYIDSLGWAYFRAGRHARALPLLQNAVEMEPGNPELNEHLGDVLWAMGRRFEARYAWQAALVGLDEDDQRTPRMRARLTDKLDGKGLDAAARP